MSEPATMAELLDWVTTSHQRFQQAVARLSEAQLLDPRLPGGWSVKDVLAHLGWWDRWLVYTLQVDGAVAPPLGEQLPTGDGWLERINAQVYALNRDRGLAEIQAEFEAARERVSQVVHELTPEDVFGAGGRSALIGQPVGPLVFGIYEHYDEHAHEIEALF